MQNQEKPKQKETEIKQDQTQKTSEKDSQKKQQKFYQNNASKDLDDLECRLYTLMQVGKNGLNFQEDISQEFNEAKHIVRDVLKLK